MIAALFITLCGRSEKWHKGGCNAPRSVQIYSQVHKRTPMRKIERQMNAAIQNNLNWQKDNTSVHFDEESGVSVVRLHGNKIAEVGDTFIRLFDGGFQSVTTKSRLNAILAEHGEDGDCVFQKKFQWFVTLNTVQGLTTVPFFSSMRLG